jgi:hypothetical protein
MVFISSTRLRLKSIFLLPSFMKANEASINQLKITSGFIGGIELIDRKLTFWTITMWDTDKNMLEFRNSPAHRKAMQKLPIWCNEASYLHWIQEEDKLPEWKIIFDKMIAEGKISKVRNPSPIHLNKNFPEMKWKRVWRKLKPVN